MPDTDILADQLRRAYDGQAWHGPAVGETLRGIDADTAAAKPSPHTHSIWEIVHHLTTWNDVPAARLRGKPITDIDDALDWPPVLEITEANWERALQRLERSHSALLEQVTRLTPDQLSDPVAGSDPTVREMLLGVLQHIAYHAGQISLLARQIAQEEASS